MTVHTLNASLDAPAYSPGWYAGSDGRRYYYDGQNWYVSNGVLLVALQVNPFASPTWQPSPSAKIQLAAGDKLRFNLSFSYIGPAVTRNFYAAIANNSKSGDVYEWSGYVAQNSKSIAACSVVTAQTHIIDIVIPDPSTFGHHGEDGAAYCKILDGSLVEGVNCTPFYYDVCHIVEAAGEITEFKMVTFIKA